MPSFTRHTVLTVRSPGRMGLPSKLGVWGGSRGAIPTRLLTSAQARSLGSSDHTSTQPSRVSRAG